ncbi:hypothetical protein VP01_6518g2 [Puccinia sorghi]|uniref:Uncharacterized protein n=1 Tax=Puccinia sorghi TaxID=27349 RepID=A0A0L6UFK4_9BASI|nr:hypothetical protein VP01_6518g2 [Puccinia sorghi]
MAEAKNQNKLKEEAGYFEIINHSLELLAYVSSALLTTKKFNGHKLWQLLKTRFAGDDLKSKTTALKKFLAVEYNSFSVFLVNVCAANQKITLSSLTLDNQVQIILMLDKLPLKFHSFKTNILMNCETCPFDQFLKKLEDFAAQNQLDEATALTHPQTMYT